MPFKKYALFAVAALFLASCGPDWIQCKTCLPGEDSAEADDGTQIPVIIVIVVDGDDDHPGTDAGTPTVDAGTPDAGRDGGTCDAGRPDAGKPDAGTHCRRVCTKYEERRKCDRGWHNSDHDKDHKGYCHPKTKKEKKCLEETEQCS